VKWLGKPTNIATPRQAGSECAAVKRGRYRKPLELWQLPNQWFFVKWHRMVIYLDKFHSSNTSKKEKPCLTSSPPSPQPSHSPSLRRPRQPIKRPGNYCVDTGHHFSVRRAGTVLRRTYSPRRPRSGHPGQEKYCEKHGGRRHCPLRHWPAVIDCLGDCSCSQLPLLCPTTADSIS
jgi:hypothetical protein